MSTNFTILFQCSLVGHLGRVKQHSSSTLYAINSLTRNSKKFGCFTPKHVPNHPFRLRLLLLFFVKYYFSSNMSSLILRWSITRVFQRVTSFSKNSNQSKIHYWSSMMCMTLWWSRMLCAEPSKFTAKKWTLVLFLQVSHTLSRVSMPVQFDRTWRLS